jgi:hypothetical protein
MNVLKGLWPSLLVFAVAGCDAMGCSGCDEVKTGDTAKLEMEQTEANQQRLVKAVPPPVLTDSLERHNLRNRLERLNKADAIGYVYLLSQDGKIIAYYTVRGKVSSLDSYLTTPTQVVKIPVSGGGYQLHDLPSPDFDGSYGKNPEGIFFFTTEGAYVEWTGHYLYSDQPLKLTQAPVLVMPVKDGTDTPPPAPAASTEPPTPHRK